MHNMSVTNIMHIIIRWECENVYPVEGQAEPCNESAIRLPSSLSSTYSSSSTSWSLGQSRPQGLAGGIVGPEYISSGNILWCSQRLAHTSGAQLGLDILAAGPNWPSWGSDDSISNAMIAFQWKIKKILTWMQKKNYLALYIYIDHHHYHNLQPTDLLKKVKIFRLPTGSQTDLLEMVKNFRYPLGSQLTFLIKEVKSFRYTQAFGDFANTQTDTQTPRWHCI